MSDLYTLCPPLVTLAAEADHMDVKHIESRTPLRPFVAALLSYYPPWLRVLYGIRGRFVRLLGLAGHGAPPMPAFDPDALPMQVGERAFIFRIVAAAEGRYWIAGADDRHLSAWLAVVAEPQGQRWRYHVATVVRYHHWTGPLYFNVIRPFHHLVVRAMMRAAARAVPAARVP